MVFKNIFVLLFVFLSISISAQETKIESFRNVISDYETLVKKGRFKEAVKNLNAFLNSKSDLTPKEKLIINNNLGILYKNQGQYDYALKYYNISESIYFKDSIPDHSALVSIYGNKVNIYSIKGEFNKAQDYCEKAIRAVSESSWDELQKQKTTASLNLNAGIIYFQLNKFNQALNAFKTSLLLKDKYKLPGKDNLYKQLANTYAKMGNNPMADKYFKFSISQSELENRDNGYNLINIYLEYAHFLFSTDETAQAFSPIQKALNISLINIGEMLLNKCTGFI